MTVSTWIMTGMLACMSVNTFFDQKERIARLIRKDSSER